MANEGDEIALIAGFNPQHSEAALGVVEGDAANQAARTSVELTVTVRAIRVRYASV